MKRLIAAAILLAVPFVANSAGGGAHLDAAHIDLTNQASLQRGARLFVNYCLSCHSASYMRYSRLAPDLGLSESQIERNLMFTTDKVGETMKAAMQESDAEAWFGIRVPDLTVISRVRGADWLYTYLRTFYRDDSRPFGVNNLVFKDVGMPHVLGELQGWQKAVYKEQNTDGVTDSAASKEVDRLELAEPGAMTTEEYDRAVRDLVAFLVYMGEPIQLERQRLGIWVILFLLGFLVLAYFLKKEYWKDIH